MLPALLRFSVLGVALVSVTTAQPAHPQVVRSPPSSRECGLVALRRQAHWVTTGAWSADGRELLLADARDRAVLRYKDTGEFRGLLLGALGETERRNKPVRIASNGSTLIAELEHLHFLRLRGSTTAPPPVALRMRTGTAERLVDKVYQWVPAGAHELYVVGEIKQLAPPNRWQTAFARMSTDDTSNFTILLDLPVDGPEKTYYRLGYPYLATAQGLPFLIHFGATISLFAGQPNGELLETAALEGLYPKSAGPPHLPIFAQPDDLQAVMQAFERLAVPAGLYGWEGRLYLLTRRPLGLKTEWKLLSIDPRTYAIVGESVLPSHANHLTVIPGHDRWAFIQKGPVKAWGSQGVQGVLLIPASRLRGRLPAKLCG